MGVPGGQRDKCGRRGHRRLTLCNSSPIAPLTDDFTSVYGDRVSEQTQGRSPAARLSAVIVGAGMAGVQTAVALRERGFTGSVTLIGAEPHQPYDRPPLSKAVLLGKAEDSAFDVDFEALDVELRLGLEVTGVHPSRYELDTVDGPVPYDVLVIATGAEPIQLPGAQGVPGVHLLRTLDDAARLRPFSPGSTTSWWWVRAGSARSSPRRRARRAAR